MVKDKLKEWLKRYGSAELTGIVFSLVFANLSMGATGNIILSAFIGAWAENLGFYGTIVTRDLQSKKKMSGRPLNLKDYFHQLRNSIVEFGPPEYLDSLVIRPFYLSLFPHLISNYTLAIFLGTLLANVTYYIPTIALYEFRKKAFKD